LELRIPRESAFWVFILVEYGDVLPRKELTGCWIIAESRLLENELAFGGFWILG
jgi:hypothetical protein